VSHRALAIALLWVSAARADEPLPAASFVVEKARAVMEKKPTHVVCRVSVETQVLDKHGKLEHVEKREGKTIFDGDRQAFESSRVVRDGKEISPTDLAKERESEKKAAEGAKSSDDLDLSPLASKNASRQSFDLLRRETLWGRPAYLLDVRANGSSETLANGKLWVDAETFVELKGELVPAKLPPHVDWIKLQEQFVLGPKSVPVPSLVRVEGAGHFLFMRKQFSTTLRWTDCQ
jgi:hypothetical protein